LYCTEDIGKHIDECQAALIKALEGEMEKPMDRRDEPITYGALIDALRSAGESVAKDNRWNDDDIDRKAKSNTEDLARSIAGILEQHIEADATDDANVRDMRRAEVGRALMGEPKPVKTRKRKPELPAIQRLTTKWGGDVGETATKLHIAAQRSKTAFEAELNDAIFKLTTVLGEMERARERLWANQLRSPILT
jgi:hypothetical protein